MNQTKYTFNFKGRQITVWAFNEREARILARAEAIRNGWDDTIIEEADKTKNLRLIDKALMAIIEMDDTLTCDEQLDCIDALRKLKNKYQHIYKGGI
jgi:hypothetical protein